jgi:hypothetical protein
LSKWTKIHSRWTMTAYTDAVNAVPLLGGTAAVDPWECWVIRSAMNGQVVAPHLHIHLWQGFSVL